MCLLLIQANLCTCIAFWTPPDTHACSRYHSAKHLIMLSPLSCRCTRYWYPEQISSPMSVAHPFRVLLMRAALLQTNTSCSTHQLLPSTYLSEHRPQTRVCINVRPDVSCAMREKFTTSIQTAWLMRTGLCSCLSLLQQVNETMADRLLVLVPHEHAHAPRSILEEARKLGPDVTEIGQSNTQWSSSPTACVLQTVHR